MWCWRAMIPGEIFTSFAKFHGIVSVDDFRLPFWLQELLQAPLRFLRFFCTDTTGSVGWPSRAPRLHIDDCFEIHNLHWELLWSAVIKSPKFSARGTAPPLRLLHGPLVILVLWQISQFRSSGKWVSTLCLPKSSLLLDVGSKDGSWEEELACESLHKIFSEFLQPFRYVGMTRVSPFLIVVFVFVWFGFFLA